MRKNGLRLLPDHVAMLLASALASLPQRSEARLTLRRLDHDRGPNWDRNNDYDVIFAGRVIGRIWRHLYKLHPWEGQPWHWYWRDVSGRANAEGHASTLELAMTDFRQAWDSDADSGVA